MRWSLWYKTVLVDLGGTRFFLVTFVTKVYVSLGHIDKRLIMKTTIEVYTIQIRKGWKSQTNLTPLAKKNLPTLFIIRLPL